MELTSNSPKAGLSNKIKVSIIILTFITLCALGVLFLKIAYSVSSADKNFDNQKYLHNIGDKLKNNGLNEQAIDQYIKYLDKAKTDALTRSTVAHTVGELYMELNNCGEALVWLFQAETIGPAYQRADELKTHIDICLIQIRSPEPKNLITR
mgnify:CR=1 FL=1